MPASQPVDMERVFHALGDRTRLAIVERLVRGPAPISAVAAPFDISLAGVIQHVQVLEKAGLVRTEKAGRTRTCHIAPQALSRIDSWISERRALWEQRFDQLGKLLDEEDDG